MFLVDKECHTGEYLSDKVIQCVKLFKIEEKIFELVGDNTLNNDVMIELLRKKLPNGHCGPTTQVRCLLHIFNLITKAIVSPFTARSKPAASDDDLDDKDVEGEVDDEAAEEDEQADEPADDNIMPGQEDPLCDLEDKETLDVIVSEIEELLKERDIVLPDISNEDFASAQCSGCFPLYAVHSNFFQSPTLIKNHKCVQD
ncbi:hypothetical protein VNI00_014809 [Paramarasmius palmivorus]|uniref:Transposase n=1 Tax=Paramarasmius palmivorus TaxID=297713 RepID=A0AAW0BRY1_9AGAR